MLFSSKQYSLTPSNNSSLMLSSEGDPFLELPVETAPAFLARLLFLPHSSPCRAARRSCTKIWTPLVSSHCWRRMMAAVDSPSWLDNPPTQRRIHHRIRDIAILGNGQWRNVVDRFHWSGGRSMPNAADAAASTRILPPPLLGKSRNPRKTEGSIPRDASSYCGDGYSMLVGSHSCRRCLVKRSIVFVFFASSSSQRTLMPRRHRNPGPVHDKGKGGVNDHPCGPAIIGGNIQCGCHWSIVDDGSKNIKRMILQALCGEDHTYPLACKFVTNCEVTKWDFVC